MISTICPFCAVGCGMTLDVGEGRVQAVTPMASHPVSRGQLCAKGWNAEKFIRDPDRLTRPLLRRHGKLEPVSWDAALRAAAQAINAAIEEGGADATGVISSARATNEDNFAAMKFARVVLGTNNIDHCARICHSPSVAGLTRTLGSGAMSNSIADLDRADCVVVIGADVTENHPIIGARMLEAKARGARLIVADPRRIRLAGFADLHLRLRLGTDIPLVNGMINTILANGWEDRAFLAERCENLDALRASVAPFSPDRAAALTGVSAPDIVKAAEWYARTPRAFLAYCLGVTQHICGTENVIALSNLALVTGHVGREGAGINPLRGQNNVQGACDMGALPDVLSGYQPVTDEGARRKFRSAWGTQLPETPGLTSLGMQSAALEERTRCLMILGEDPIVTDPAQHHVRRALEALDTLIVVELFPTDTALCADIVLPAAGFAEKEGTITSTERRVQRVRRAVTPPGEARSDWEILEALAGQLGRPMGFESAEGIFDEMARLTPIYGGMTYARLSAGAGLQWPCPHLDHPGTAILHRDGIARGKGRLIPVAHTPPAELPDAEYPFQLTTSRLHFQYGCGSMTRRAPLLERENPKGILWIHPADALARGISDGTPVRVRSRRGEVTTRAVLSDEVMPGMVTMPYHFSEAPSNILTNNALDPISKMPELKVCAVAVDRKV